MTSEVIIEIPKQEIDIKTIAGDIPRNYTVFVRALEHVVIGGEKPLHHHAMSQAEYERFVSDMWIGIVLTMVVVFIVFALCIWYMYHKFQQWKRNYDARSRMRASGNSPSTTDLETLPNYSLVSGLPTYDDALEQLRLSNTTNHLLIKHQTIMKFFDTVNDKIDRPETPLPSYEDATTKTAVISDWAPSDLDVCQPSYKIIPNDSVACAAATPASNTQIPVKLFNTGSLAVLQNLQKQNRFTCTLVSEPSSSPSNASNSNAEQLALVVGHSLGNLNIINEIKKSRPDVPWVHRSTQSLSLDNDSNSTSRQLAKNEHRGSLY